MHAYADTLRGEALTLRTTRGADDKLDEKSYINMLESIADEIDKVLDFDRGD